jgi:tetratricopeptide (TPR) repeat protein
MPWLSSAYERAGLGVASDDPVLAYERLDRAAALNRLSADPLLVKGSIALRRRDTELARDSFQLALEREPTNWFGHLQLAMVAAVVGDYDDARASVARAQELNPRDPVVEIAAELIERREPVDPELLNRLYAEGENRLSLNYLLNTYFGGRRFDEPAS